MNEYLMVAEDDPRVARCLGRFFARTLPVVLVRSFREGTAQLKSPAIWLGAVLDASLPDGCGLDLLDAFRKIERRAPVMILTGHCEPEFINRANRHDAGYAVKPPQLSNLHAFMAEALNHRASRARNIDVIVETFGEQFKLTASERKILTAAVRGASRKELPRKLGRSEGTIKVQVRTLLRKCQDAEELGDVVRDIWRMSTE